MRRSLAQSSGGAIRLELSGPALSGSLQRLVAGCEEAGGVEQYVRALEVKGALFRDLLGEGGAHAATLEPEALRTLCAFMPTVRRRIGPWLERPAYDALREDILGLLAAAPGGAIDARLGAFGTRFCGGERPRWVRDLGAELLHQLDPERIPLMTRWVWDRATNTGVLREIWFGAEGASIDVPDSQAAFLALREELSGFLGSHGVFRDVIHYVDLLCAQVYAEYICTQGGSYLRVDFSAADDPSPFTRRLLGLDGIKCGSHGARARNIDGCLGAHPGAAARRMLD